jgi:hypothetical protein
MSSRRRRGHVRATPSKTPESRNEKSRVEDLPKIWDVSWRLSIERTNFKNWGGEYRKLYVKESGPDGREPSLEDTNNWTLSGGPRPNSVRNDFDSQGKRSFTLAKIPPNRDECRNSYLVFAKDVLRESLVVHDSGNHFWQV